MGSAAIAAPISCSRCASEAVSSRTPARSGRRASAPSCAASRTSAAAKRGRGGKPPRIASSPPEGRSMCAGYAAPPCAATSAAAASSGRSVAGGSRKGSSPQGRSCASIRIWRPKTSGRFFTRMRCGRTARSKSIAAASVGNRQTRWISSAVVSSMPPTGTAPYASHAAKNAGQLAALLWSVSAATSAPARRAMPAASAGVISSSAQGERHEWMCSSALRPLMRQGARAAPRRFRACRVRCRAGSPRAIRPAPPPSRPAARPRSG